MVITFYWTKRTFWFDCLFPHEKQTGNIFNKRTTNRLFTLCLLGDKSEKNFDQEKQTDSTAYSPPCTDLRNKVSRQVLSVIYTNTQRQQVPPQMQHENMTPSSPEQQCQLHQTTYCSDGCTDRQKIVLSATVKLDKPNSTQHGGNLSHHRRERKPGGMYLRWRKKQKKSEQSCLKKTRTSALHSQSSTSSGLRSLSSSSSSFPDRLLYSCLISLLTSTSTRCLTGGALWSQRE